MQVLIFHFTLCLVSAKFFNSTNFFANFFLLRFLHGALHQTTNIFVLHWSMFLRSLSRDYILLMNNSIEMHSAQIIGKVFKNIYRNQDLSFALIKLLSKIKCIYCNPLTAFQGKKTVINNLGNDIFTDYSYSFANNSFRWQFIYFCNFY